MWLQQVLIHLCLCSHLLATSSITSPPGLFQQKLTAHTVWTSPRLLLFFQGFSWERMTGREKIRNFTIRVPLLLWILEKLKWNLFPSSSNSWRHSAMYFSIQTPELYWISNGYFFFFFFFSLSNFVFWECSYFRKSSEALLKWIEN